MDKKYIYNQLDSIDKEIENAYYIMIERGFDLTSEELKTFMTTIRIIALNIKDELDKEDNDIYKDLSNVGYFNLDISKPGRPEVKEEIRKYLDSSL